MKFDMFIPTKILFGKGSLNDLHNELMPGKKAMIVISNGTSAKSGGYLKRLEDELHKAGAQTCVFDKIEANPLRSTVMAGGNFARQNNCDFVVALGGGSCMDAAKSIALIAVNDGDYWDYIQSGSGKSKPVSNKPLPLIAVTTTAGTGSEADAGTVVTNEITHEKTGFVHPSLFPVISVVDPELMLSVPPKFTAFQGFDALFHSVEGYISNRANMLSDIYALNAIKNIAEYLPVAFKNGNDLEAREKTAFANTLSGFVMCLSSCTSEHSLEHALSAYHQELPHGAGLIMISKAYHGHFIKAGASDERYINMAKAMGMEKASKPEDFLTALHNLMEECGVANLKMSDYGIEKAEFEKFAENAKSAMGVLFDFDRVPLELSDCVEIYKNSYK